MSFVRCFSSLGCPDLSLDETLALAAKHHVPVVELRALGGIVDLPAYFDSCYGSPENLAGRLRGSSVRVVALGSAFRLIGASAVEREQLLTLARWADAAQVPWIRVFDGGKGVNSNELAEAAETVRWWRHVRRERGWTADIMVETHDSLLTGESIARFITAVPGAAVLWDAHHTWKTGGENPATTWTTIRPAVVHVHVKDSVSVPSARHPFTYVLPGEGEFPIASVLAALRATGFAGPVSLEWEKTWHPYLPSLDDALTIAAARGWW